MTDLKTLDHLYAHIMKTIVSTGVAPHYTEIATSLGVEVEQARTSLNDLMGPGKMAGSVSYTHLTLPTILLV